MSKKPKKKEKFTRSDHSFLLLKKRADLIKYCKIKI